MVIYYPSIYESYCNYGAIFELHTQSAGLIDFIPNSGKIKFW